MCPCVRLSYRSVNYRTESGTPSGGSLSVPTSSSPADFSFPAWRRRDVTAKASPRSAANIAQILMKSEKDHFGPVSRKKEHMPEIYLGDPDDLKRLVNAPRRYHDLAIAPQLAQDPGVPRGGYSARERARQPKPWVARRCRSEDGADPIAGEVSTRRPVQERGCRHGPKAAPRTPVDHSPASARGQTFGPSRRYASRATAPGLVFEGKWWHGDGDVVGEQRDQRVEIADQAWTNLP